MMIIGCFHAHEGPTFAEGGITRKGTRETNAFHSELENGGPTFLKPSFQEKMKM